MATFLSVLRIVSRQCARLTYFLHPKLRKINVVLITPKLIPLPLRRAGSIPFNHCLRPPLPPLSPSPGAGPSGSHKAEDRLRESGATRKAALWEDGMWVFEVACCELPRLMPLHMLQPHCLCSCIAAACHSPDPCVGRLRGRKSHVQPQGCAGVWQQSAGRGVHATHGPVGGGPACDSWYALGYSYAILLGETAIAS